jgi:hypothetical protein
MIVSMKTKQATDKETHSPLYQATMNVSVPTLKAMNKLSKYTSQLFKNAVSSKKVKKTSKPTPIL